jgi:hypothetical protein
MNSVNDYQLNRSEFGFPIWINFPNNGIGIHPIGEANKQTNNIYKFQPH